MSVSTEFRDLIKDFEQYKTTNTEFHAGDLLEHSAWTAYYVNDLYTNLDMNNPLHKVWNQQYVDDAKGLNIDDKKVLILAAFLHDIGKGGDLKTTYYDKPDHESKGADYISNSMSYRDINSNKIDLEKMFKDFGLNGLEVKIITTLVEGHWLIGKVISKPKAPTKFIKFFEGIYKGNIKDKKSTGTVAEPKLFKLVAMMQLIICIADVMATKKYDGHTISIKEFPEIPFIKDAPHKPAKYMYENFKYDFIIDKFVPMVYKYLDKDYNTISSSSIEQIINNISSIQIDVIKTVLKSNAKTIDDSSIERIIQESIANKRYDILAILYKELTGRVSSLLINELLVDGVSLDEFITYIKGEKDYKRYAVNILNNIIRDSIPEALTPFLTNHKEFLTIETLNTSKIVYKDVKKSKTRELEAEIVYNQIKANYKVPNGFYKDEKHKEFCEEITPKNYPDPFVETMKTTVFQIPTIIKDNFKPIHLISPEKELWRDLKQISSYDNYGGQVSSLFGNDFTLDMDWVYSCIKYIRELPIEDKYTIFGYTHNGDEFVNLLLMNNIPNLKSKIDEIKKSGKTKYIKQFYFPLFFQLISIIKEGKNPSIKRLIDTSPFTLTMITNIINNKPLDETYEAIINSLEYFTDELYVECIKMFSEDLSRIIDNSPVISKTSILYRGVKDKYYYSDPSKTIFQTNTFISTSFNAESAFEFAERKCCFKKIIAGPGTKGIFMEAITSHPGENEILLNVGTKFNIIDDKDKLFFDNDQRSLKDICKSDDGKFMNVTTMEFVP